MSKAILSQDEFVKRVQAKYGSAYEILSHYTSGHNKVQVRHVECGYEWMVDPWNLMQGIIKSCPMCSNKWKRDDKTFRAEVAALFGSEYVVIGKYINTSTQIEMVHTECGHSFMRIPRELKQGVLCPHCRRPNYHETTESFKERLADEHDGKYVLVGQYIDARTPC